MRRIVVRPTRGDVPKVMPMRFPVEVDEGTVVLARIASLVVKPRYPRDLSLIWILLVARDPVLRRHVVIMEAMGGQAGNEICTARHAKGVFRLLGQKKCSVLVTNAWGAESDEQGVGGIIGLF